MSEEDRSCALVAFAVLMILLHISRLGRLLYRAGALFERYRSRRPAA